MSFNIDCPCGRTIEVTAAHAGSDIRCVCGNVQAVPALSELRQRAGKSRYAVDIAESIRYMVADGQLPADDKCVTCGITTDNVLRFVIVCERQMPKGPGFWNTFFLWLLSPLSAAVGEYSRTEDDDELMGREKIVKAPVRICPPCANAITLKRRGEMTDLLDRVPLYARLLRKYPDAQIAIS
jgi:hypothetical protein